MSHAAKFGDLVLGVDLHRVIVPGAPQPAPLPHPFIGIVYDPLGAAISAAVSKLAGGGGLTLVQGSPAATVAMDVVGQPHVPLPPGTSFSPDDIPDNKGMIVTGSKTVTIGGLSAARLGSRVSSCGWPLNLPTSVCLSAPIGKPVLIGGPDAFEVLAAVTRGIRTSWFSARAHQVFKVKPGTRLSKTICFLTGHPVNVMTGEVLTEAVDFALPGPIELVFERNYASRCTTEGPLGPGWSHPLDGWVDERGDKIATRLPDGREREHQALRRRELVWDDLDRYEIERAADGYVRTTWDGLRYTFARIAGAPVSHPLVKVEDRCGNAITMRYRNGHLCAVIDSAGRALRFETERGRLARVLVRRWDLDDWQVLVRYEYEGGLLAAAIDAEGHALRYEYQVGVLAKETNRKWLSFYFEYDEPGADGWCVHTWGDGGIFERRITYDKDRAFTMVEDSRGGRTHYYGNDAGLVDREVDPTGKERRYEWDEHCRKVAEIDGLGGRFAWGYDTRGNCVSERDALGHETRRTFNALNLPVRLEDAAGHVWRRRYDDRGCLREETDPLGNTTRFEVDRRGSLTEIVDALGKRSVMSYNERGELVEARDSEGATTRFENDALGRVVRQVDARGGETRLAWDRCGRLVGVRRADGSEARFVLDPEGNVIEHRDGLGQRWRFRYEGLNRLVERVDPAGGWVRYALDTEEELVGLTNEVGEAYQLVLDLAGRVVKEIGFDGRVQEYEYDAAGHCRVWVNGARRRAKVERDAAGQIVKLEVPAAPPPGKVLPGVEEIGFAWDARGLLVRASNAAGEVSLERDALGRVVAERFGDFEVASEYDAVGNRAGRKTSLGHEARYEVDGRGALTAVSIAQASAWAPWRIEIARDALGAEVERRLPGGVVSRWERDVAGMPVVQRVLRQGKALLGLGFRWRPEQQLAGVVDTERGPTSYVHDVRGVLIGARGPDGTAQERPVDEVGNVFRAADRRDRAYGTGGRLLLVGDVELRHGADGEVVEKVLPDGKRWRYRWDARGQLVEVARPDGAVVEFAYDALGRRVAKRAAGRTTVYRWDGDELVHEVVEGAGVVTWEMDPETLGPLAKIEGVRRWGAVTDPIGAPRMLVGEGGEIAWRGVINLFGEVDVEGAVTACPWRWPGQYEDEEIGLFYNRFRYYDPELGRYLSQDPIGLLGGTALYAYVGDPLSWIDPLGLNCGKQGERIARAWLKKRGFNVIGGVRNRSNHGIDIVARDAGGQLWFFEVKTTEGLVAPALSREQAMGAFHYVPSRLGRAVRNRGAWGALHDPQTSATAKALLREINQPGGGFSSELIQITLGNGGIKAVPW